MKLVVSQAAIADLRRLHAFLANRNVAVAGRAVAPVTENSIKFVGAA
jgi:hypothetical protein